MSLWKRKAAYLSVDTEMAYFLPQSERRTEIPHLAVPADFGKSPFDAAQKLAETMSESNTNPGILDIVLSDRLVRYLVTPLIQGLRNAGELHQAALARFEQVYGIRPADWCVVTDMELSTERFLSCAVEMQLKESLSQHLRNAGYKIRSMQPAFVAAHRLLSRQVKSLPAWSVVINNNCTTIGYKDALGWAGVRAHPVCIRQASELITLLQLNRLYFCPASSGTQGVWVSGLEEEHGTTSDIDGWQIRVMPKPLFLAPAWDSAKGLL